MIYLLIKVSPYKNNYLIKSNYRREGWGGGFWLGGGGVEDREVDWGLMWMDG